MPTIITLHDPQGINRREVETVPEDSLLMSWLVERFGADGFDIPTKVYLNRVAPACELKLHDHVATGYPLAKDDMIIICRMPQGIPELAYAIISFVVALAVTLLTPKPKIPEFQQAQQSPNNSLTGQTNVVRLHQRIPDIYGKGKVYPDLIANSYFEFISHVKNQTEYLCIGRGEYLVEELKSGENLISELPNSTATVYEPFTRPTELLSARQSNSVDGQEVPAPNAKKMEAFSTKIKFTNAHSFFGLGNVMQSYEDLVSGDQFTLTYASDDTVVIGSSDITFIDDMIYGSFGFVVPIFSVGLIVNVTGTVGNNGQYQIAESTTVSLKCISPVTGLPTSFIYESGTSATVSAVFDNDGTYTFNSLTVHSDPTFYTVDVAETTFSSFAVALNAISESVPTGEATVGPFAIPGNPDQVWFNIEFPRGLDDGSGGFTTVKLNLQLQEIDSGGSPIGDAEDAYYDFTDNTVDPRAYTRKITPGNPGGLYEASVIRITDEGAANDSARWTGLFGMEDVTVSDFGDVTTVLVNAKATEQATRAQERKFNAVVTRKLVTYSGGSITTTKLPTARMADAMLNILTDPRMGNKAASKIDLDALYAIQESLDADAIYGDKLGRFCYTFSDINAPVGTEIETCANTCRVFVTRRGDIIDFARDQAQANRVTLFNTRNKKPDSELKTITLQKPNDPDGISLEWIDETTGDAGTIVMPEGTPPINPTIIKAAGTRNYEQAWNRAKYEYLRLIYQRTQVKTLVTADGLLVSLGNRVANQDGTLVASQGGEVIAVDGLTITTSERIDFDGNPSGTVILRDEAGDASTPVQATPGAETNQIILASAPFDIRVRGDFDYQVGTLYVFSPDSDHATQDYMLSTIEPGSDGYVTLGLINYTDEIYSADTEIPTPA